LFFIGSIVAFSSATVTPEVGGPVAATLCIQGCCDLQPHLPIKALSFVTTGARSGTGPVNHAITVQLPDSGLQCCPCEDKPTTGTGNVTQALPQ
jgi:hypothetical protein